MRKRKIRIPPARAFTVRQDRIAELNVSVIVQARLALWIEPVALGRGKIHFPKVFPHRGQILKVVLLVFSPRLSPDERSDVEQSFSLKLPQITSSNHSSERARLGGG